MSSSPDPVVTNAYVYHEIAIASLATAEALREAHRRPRGDGSDGYVLTLDPNRGSFKHSLIAIVFSGMFIEAALWLYGSRKLGVDGYRKIDRWELERRLQGLGIKDEGLEGKLKAYRQARKELVHEKAVPLSSDTTPIRRAQKEARKAVELMREVERVLQQLGENRDAT